MDFIDELLNNKRLSSFEKDLAAVKLNDLHFTDEEKQQAMQRLEKRMTQYDKRSRWRRLAIAAVATVLLCGVGITGWHLTHADSHRQDALVVPRNLDMVLTTTDGHALNLSEGGQLVCNELGYLTIKGPGQTLVCKPSPNQESTMAKEGGLCELRVPEGKRTQIELSDGSRVWVNSATTVRFPIKFEGAERSVEVNGEAYFEVAHQQDCPFQVKTDKFTVEVLGTKFDVMAYADQETAHVVLAEGRIKVLAADSLICALQPDQLLTFTDGQAATVNVEAYTYTAWKDGLLYLNGTTLNEALSWLARQYAVDINCSPSCSRLKLHGKLVLEQRVEDVLDNLTVIEPITYLIRNNQIFVDEK